MTENKIVKLQYLSTKEYEEISALEQLCVEKDQCNLKLEIDYKMSLERNQNNDDEKNQDEKSEDEKNEFLYYIDQELVGYLGICSFGGKRIAEINGVVHPEHRRKGIFTKLFQEAIEECKIKAYDKILLLSDRESGSGIAFIKSVGGLYSFSENRMVNSHPEQNEGVTGISLRLSNEYDMKEIAKQNAIYFGLPQEDIEGRVEELEGEAEIQEPNVYNYMIEKDGTILGKIKIHFQEDSGFVSGFGILPEFRGKGYGKQGLKQALHLICEKGLTSAELDVESENNNALRIYLSCGFEPVSTMDYYTYQ